VQNHYLRSLLLLLLCLGAGTVQAQNAQNTSGPQAIQWEDLTDDESRASLAYYEVLRYAPPGEKDVLAGFKFPANANDGIYGIDVSHHNGQVDWKTVAKGGAKFVYIKASQGGQYRDKMFSQNWDGAAKQNIRRGAYHFLTANVGGREQANAYLAMLESVGGLGEDDLTPVLDLEWDLEKRNGSKVDRWAALTPQQISKIVLDWVSAVEASTGRKPMIYTAASWWNERMGGNTDLQKYYQWLADYRQSSIANKAPLPVKKHAHRAWQFTDRGHFDGMVNKFDVNKLNGSDLKELMGK